MRRILITGSREWTDEASIFKAIDEHHPRGGAKFVVVHGDCPSGADALARKLCRYHYWQAEPHPAKWDESCGPDCHHMRFRNGRPNFSCAGPVRNQLMVDLGADICLAFPLPGSRGTWDCMGRAEAAGIEVVNLGRRG